MNTLTGLVDNLHRLKTLSSSILQQMLPIMRKINRPNNDIFRDVKDGLNCNVTDREITERLQEMTLKLIDDASVVHKEIDLFVEASAIQDGVESKIKEYPFLANVWFGDFYEELEGYRAIEKLAKELQESYAKCDEERIIEDCIESFKQH